MHHTHIRNGSQKVDQPQTNLCSMPSRDFIRALKFLSAIVIGPSSEGSFSQPGISRAQVLSLGHILTTNGCPAVKFVQWQDYGPRSI